MRRLRQGEAANARIQDNANKLGRNTAESRNVLVKVNIKRRLRRSGFTQATPTSGMFHHRSVATLILRAWHPGPTCSRRNGDVRQAGLRQLLAQAHDLEVIQGRATIRYQGCHRLTQVQCAATAETNNAVHTRCNCCVHSLGQQHKNRREVQGDAGLPPAAGTYRLADGHSGLLLHRKDVKWDALGRECVLHRLRPRRVPARHDL